MIPPDDSEHDDERGDVAGLLDLPPLGTPLALVPDYPPEPVDWWADATPAERNRYRTYRRH